MARPTPFTLTAEFIDRHPVTAARTLETLDPTDSAALIGNLPSRLTAPVLEAMLPPYAARCLEQLDLIYARAALQRLGTASGAQILRQLAAAPRAELLAELPRLRRIGLQRLLRYPAETVGAWMDPEPPLLAESATADAAVRQCRRWSGSLDGPFYLVDEAQRLVGLLHPGELLRADSSQPVRTLAGPVPLALSPRDTLTVARARLRRRSEVRVPVVDRSGRLLGLLDRASIYRPEAPGRQQAPEGPGSGLAADLLAAWWLVVKSLAGLALGGGGYGSPRR